MSRADNRLLEDIITALNGVSGSELTDAQLRATPVPVSGSFYQATQPVSGTFWQTTQPVSGTFWQTTQPVSGTFYQATQPVSASSLPLPTGASTEDTLAAIKTIFDAVYDPDTVSLRTELDTSGSFLGANTETDLIDTAPPPILVSSDFTGRPCKYWSIQPVGTTGTTSYTITLEISNDNINYMPIITVTEADDGKMIFNDIPKLGTFARINCSAINLGTGTGVNVSWAASQ